MGETVANIEIGLQEKTFSQNYADLTLPNFDPPGILRTG